MPFDKRTLVLPADTTFGERVIVTRGDVVLADGCRVDFGFETPARVFVGERVELGGPVTAGGDVRMDLFSAVDGDVTSGASAYLGERVHVKGRLRVEHDLDVGDDVKIEKGFEAHGWINIRNPVPMVIYLFVYMMHLLQMGRSEEVEKVLKELEDSEASDETFAVSEVFLFLPENSRLGLQESRIRGGMDVGEGARLLGNFRADGPVDVAGMVKIHGAVRAGGDVTLGDFTEVHGDVVTKGALVIGNGCHVYGRVEADRVEMKQTALVDGEIIAPSGIKFVTPAMVTMEEKVEDFETTKAPDVLDLLK